jgi:hypothetical protein
MVVGMPGSGFPMTVVRKKRALDGLKDWLTGHGFPSDQAPSVVEHVKEFYVRSSLILGLPAALTITRGDEACALRVHVLWPAAIPPSERPACDEALQGAFERDLPGALAPGFSCSMSITEHPPKAREQDIWYLGPSPGGYQKLAEEFRAAGRAIEDHPVAARQLYSVIRSLPGKSAQERRQLAQRVRALATILRSA